LLQGILICIAGNKIGKKAKHARQYPVLLLVQHIIDKKWAVSKNTAPGFMFFVYPLQETKFPRNKAGP
ncbi:MAG: hypothetical protein ACM3YE_06935, partial [Bacteroidota bacterium]